MTVTLVIICSTVVALAAAFPANLTRPNYDNIPQCGQPMERGMCLAYMPSFFYESSSGKCLPFIYGGCQGNLNRFKSEGECMKTCEGFKPTTRKFELITESSETAERSVEKKDICSLPMESGHCYANFEKYYFNGEKCEAFTYGGCAGNENNFFTIDDCETACPPKDPAAEGNDTTRKFELITESSETAERSEEKKDICSLPVEPGHCYANFEKYYFNGEKCEAFTYGGCAGNENNFLTIDDCETACPPKDPAAEDNNASISLVEIIDN